MVDKILARLKKLWQQIVDWWTKFTKKQKWVIVGVTAGVLVALIVLVGALTKTQYTFLIATETSKEGSEVRDILRDAGVTYKVTADGRSFSVKKGQESIANLALGSEGYASDAYSDLKSLLSGGFTQTESDKQKLTVKNAESQLTRDLSTLKFVKSVRVNLNVPNDDGTLISSKQEASASVIFSLKEPMTSEQAANVARSIATALGNATTRNITIMDDEGNLYFSGADENSLTGQSGSQQTIRNQESNFVKAKVLSVLNGLGEFDNISIAANVDIDFSSGEDTSHRYESQFGEQESVYSQKFEASAESTSGEGGIPGTTSNTDDQTTYTIGNNSESSTMETENQYYYLPDEYLSTRIIPSGTIKNASSSISVATVTYNVITYADAKAQGFLDDMSWAEYKRANRGRTKLEVDPDWVNTVAMAAGVPASNISFVAYMENVFKDTVKTTVKATDIVTIILIVLILALLAFVLLRAMKTKKEVEPEPEISVESLIQKQETPVEDIELEEKSMARRSIEKFVDENPELVANLLRNWLNEDWGV